MNVEAQALHSLQPITVGDPVPDIAFRPLLNSPQKVLRLSDFRGKMVILDFWATWCSSCLGHLPEMDSLQKAYKDKLQVIMVNTTKTGDTPARIAQFLEKWKKRYPDFDLPIVVGDSIADRLFPHRLIPHYVWIGENGKVRAITAADKVNGLNIQRMISRDVSTLPQKEDWDMKKPLFLNSDVAMHHMIHYSILLKGKIDGLPAGNHRDEKGGKVYRWAITNTPLLKMYELIIRHIFPEFNARRLILDVKDSSALSPEFRHTDKTSWYQQHLYSYDQRVPYEKADSLYQYMLLGLNQYSGYVGKVETRTVPCLVLVQTEEGEDSSSQGQSQFPGDRSSEVRLDDVSMPYLAAWLDSHITLDLPVIDGTSSPENMDVIFDPGTNFSDLADIRRQLAHYHLDLVKALRRLPVFVLKDKP